MTRWASLLLALWGLALLLQVPREPPETRGAARLFAPAGPPPWKALVCLHSVFQDPDTAEAPARAAARAGMLGVQVVLSAGGAFEEHLGSVRGVLADLRRDPRVGEVFLYGHSMGADLACTVADPETAGVVAVGFPVDPAAGRLGQRCIAHAHRDRGSPETPGVARADVHRGCTFERGDSPEGLLLAVGAWDELHPLSEMRAVGAPLLVLPAADHAAETVSPDLFEATAEFCGARRGVALRPDPFVGRGLLALGLVLPFRLLLKRLKRPAAGAGALLLLAWAVDLPGLTAAVGVAALLAASFPDAPFALRRLLLVLGIAGVALLVNSWESWAYAAWLPVFLAQAVPLALARLGSSLSPLGVPGWGALAWVLVELAAPGALARGLGTAHGRLVEAVRRLDLRPRTDMSPASVLVLLVCAGAAAQAWREVGRAGYALDTGEVLRLVGLFARLVVLPAVLWVAAVRTGLWGTTAPSSR